MTKDAQDRFYQMVGERIKDARKAAGLKQEALAAYLDLSRVSVVNIEKGRQHPPLHLLLDIAKILKVNIQSLIPEMTPFEKSSKTNWEHVVDLKLAGDKEGSEKVLSFLNQLYSGK